MIIKYNTGDKIEASFHDKKMQSNSWKHTLADTEARTQNGALAKILSALVRVFTHHHYT